MEFKWKLTQSGPFPDGIRNTIANLRAALVIREAEALQDVEIPVLSTQAPERGAGDDETREEEKTRKDKILEKSCQEEWMTDDNLTSRIVPLFNWVEDINTLIGLNDIAHNKLTPLTNINKSGDVFPITCSATTPTTVTPVNPINAKDDVNPVTLANTTVNTHTAAIQVPCDLSVLCSSAQNPWESLWCHHYGRYPHTPRQFTRQYTQQILIYIQLRPRHHPLPLLLTFSKQFRIRPNKPVIRVPMWMEMTTSTHPTLSDWAIAKSVPPSHPAAHVQCHCGQLVPISDNQMFRSFPLHHAFSSFISQFISLSFPFPRQLFLCCTFS
jgi:hypothetical protein